MQHTENEHAHMFNLFKGKDKKKERKKNNNKMSQSER